MSNASGRQRENHLHSFLRSLPGSVNFTVIPQNAGGFRPAVDTDLNNRQRFYLFKPLLEQGLKDPKLPRLHICMIMPAGGSAQAVFLFFVIRYRFPGILFARQDKLARFWKRKSGENAKTF